MDKLESVAKFLTQSLQHLGLKEHVRYGPYDVGMGEAAPYFWLAAVGGPDTDEKIMNEILKKQHVAFTTGNQSVNLGRHVHLFSPFCHYYIVYLYIFVDSQNTSTEQVQQFYDAALKAGATDNGPPGPRPQYHLGYFGAFVLDPVCGMHFKVVYHEYNVETKS